MVQMSHIQEKTIYPKNICRINIVQFPRDLSRLVKTTVFVTLLLSMRILKQEVIMQQNSSQLQGTRKIKGLHTSGTGGLEIRAAFLFLI